MSNLVNHAKRELKLAGFPTKPVIEPGYEIDYDYEVAQAVLELVEKFAGQHHSGLSASMVIDLTQRLLNFEALTKLTDDPLDWNLVGDKMWQSRRQSDSFSKDGGKTYYRLDERRRWWSTALRHLPRRMYQWLWDNHTGAFYPMHTSASHLDNPVKVS